MHCKPAEAAVKNSNHGIRITARHPEPISPLSAYDAGMQVVGGSCCSTLPSASEGT
jgi:hypothetical protein